jgi:uncharacterized oxidoreductase
MKLTGNTILITGGTSGIGLELARQLLVMGNTVIVTGRDPGKIAEVKSGLPGIHVFQSDVSRLEDITSLYLAVTTQFPGLNMLINNAGIMRNLNLTAETISAEDCTREIDINLSGPVRMNQVFMPHLLKQSRAAIMNITSCVAFIPFHLAPVYSATKAGLHSYSQSLRIQLKDTGIKVFELAPPSTATGFMDVFETDINLWRTGPMMSTSTLVKAAIRGLKRDTPEIAPGISRLLRLMSRIAPRITLYIISRMTLRHSAK